jgi:hypothetical protein
MRAGVRRPEACGAPAFAHDDKASSSARLLASWRRSLRESCARSRASFALAKDGDPERDNAASEDLGGQSRVVNSMSVLVKRADSDARAMRRDKPILGASIPRSPVSVRSAWVEAPKLRPIADVEAKRRCPAFAGQPYLGDMDEIR